MRTRALVGMGLLALAGVLVSCSSEERPAATQPTEDREPLVAWVSTDKGGVSTVSIDGQTRQAPGRVEGFAATADAVGWTTRAGEVWVLDADQGTPQLVGRDAPSRLIGDEDGRLLAWTEFPAGGQVELVVWDTTNGKEALRSTTGTRRSEEMRESPPFYSEVSPWPPRDRRPSTWVYALDGAEVYWLNERGAMRTHVDSGEEEVLDPEGNYYSVRAVQDDVIVSRTFQGGDTVGAYTVGDALYQGTKMKQASYHFGGLSPSGTRLVANDVVYDTTDGTALRTLDVGAMGPPELVGFLDEHTVWGRVVRGGRYDLVRCRVDTGKCATDGDGSNLLLPRPTQW